MDGVIISICQLFMIAVVLLLVIVVLISADILLQTIRAENKKDRYEDIYWCPYDDLYTDANYEEESEDEGST